MECFKSEADRDLMVENYRDDRGQIKATEAVQWVYEKGFGNNAISPLRGYETWHKYLPMAMDVIVKLENEGRGFVGNLNNGEKNEIKRGGQVGEAVHDYGLSEALLRGNTKVDKFICMYNDDYKSILETCPQDCQTRVRDEWIAGIRGLSRPSKVTEAIGDFFEFFELYLFGHGLRAEFLAFMANSLKQRNGQDALDRAIDYERVHRERRARDQEERTVVLMMVEQNQDSLSEQTAVFNPTIECYICEKMYNEDSNDITECHVCAKPVCVDCCQPIYQDECKHCQIAQFLRWEARGHGEQIADPDTEHGNALSEEPGNVPQGLTNQNLEARLAALIRNQTDTPAPTQHAAAWAIRQRQEDAYTNTSLGPPDLRPTVEWRPPYAPFHLYPNQMPAIFTHPYYNQTDTPVRQNPMDPPIAPEAMSVLTGMPLIVPVTAQNRYVRDQADQIHSTAAHRTGDNALRPIPAYHPARDGNPTEAIGLNIDDRNQQGVTMSNRFFLQDLSGIHHQQQASMQRSYDKFFKGKGKGRPREQNQHAVPRYEGLDNTCTICLHDFHRGDVVTRLNCNHLFHEQCWDGLLWASTTDEDCACPNCRGPAMAKAIFRFVGHEITNASRRIGGRARPGSGSESSRHSEPQEFVLMMQDKFMTAEQLAEYHQSWTTLTPEEFFKQQTDGRAGQPAPDDVDNVETVHLKASSKTKLTDGNSLLCDLGSRINLIGKVTEKEFADSCRKSGYEPVYTKRTKRLHVNGVGSDSAFCDYTVTLPIAVKYEDREATKESYHANIAEGCGENLPGIYGLDSMQDKDSVILLRKGKEMIIFPGPGGYKIEWSPGSRLLPMKPAPSGHLVIPCDKFDTLNTVKGNTEQITFWTDHTTSE